MRYLTTLLLVALSSYVFAVNPYTLTDLDGRSFQAIILSKSNESVTVLNLDGQDFNIPLSQLTKSNDASLKSWTGAARTINEGRYDLADAYYTGNGVKKDLKKAFNIFQRGAKAGDANCQLMMAYSYRDGEGVKGNHVKAAQWFEKAAQQGHSMAEAMLGRAYLNGNGVGKNYTYAGMYISRSAAHNNSYGLYLYGYMNYYGFGIKKNQQEGMRLLQLSAKAGDTSAKDLLTKISSQRAVAAARARSVEAYETSLNKVEEMDTLILNNGVVVKLNLASYIIHIYSYVPQYALLYKQRSGTWRVWVEGHGDYQCEILKVPSPAPKATKAEAVRIDEVMSDGSVVKMLDGRIFEVRGGRGDASRWIGYDDGILLEGRRLLNIDRDDIIEVSQLR